MGFRHFIFGILSGLTYLLLFFDHSEVIVGFAQIVKISIATMGILILGSLVLHRNYRFQLRALNIIQIVVVLLTAVYYYLLWQNGAFSNWLQGDHQQWWFMIVMLCPIFGYGFLSISVRILHRNLKLIRSVDRLRD